MTLFAYMAYVGHALTAGPEIAPSDRRGLFAVSEDSSPLVEYHYVGQGWMGRAREPSNASMKLRPWRTNWNSRFSSSNNCFRRP